MAALAILDEASVVELLTSGMLWVPAEVDRVTLACAWFSGTQAAAATAHHRCVSPSASAVTTTSHLSSLAAFRYIVDRGCRWELLSSRDVACLAAVHSDALAVLMASAIHRTMPVASPTQWPFPHLCVDASSTLSRSCRFGFEVGVLLLSSL